MRAKLGEKKSKFKLYAALVLALMAMACASGNQAARKDIESAESAMNRAQIGNAQKYAPLELELAQAKLARAHEAFEHGNYKKARYRAQEAQADASLAASKTQTAKTKDAVKELQNSIARLRNQIEQSQKVQ